MSVKDNKVIILAAGALEAYSQYRLLSGQKGNPATSPCVTRRTHQT